MRAFERRFLKPIRISSAVAVGFGGNDFDLSLPPAQLMASSFGDLSSQLPLAVLLKLDWVRIVRWACWQQCQKGDWTFVGKSDVLKLIYVKLIWYRKQVWRKISLLSACQFYIKKYKSLACCEWPEASSDRRHLWLRTCFEWANLVMPSSRNLVSLSILWKG